MHTKIPGWSSLSPLCTVWNQQRIPLELPHPIHIHPRAPQTRTGCSNPHDSANPPNSIGSIVIVVPLFTVTRRRVNTLPAPVADPRYSPDGSLQKAASKLFSCSRFRKPPMVRAQRNSIATPATERSRSSAVFPLTAGLHFCFYPNLSEVFWRKKTLTKVLVL